MSNALSENINSQIGTYLSISNGINNFTRFRKRCLLTLNKKVYYFIHNQLSKNNKKRYKIDKIITSRLQKTNSIDKCYNYLFYYLFSSSLTIY